MVEQKYLGVLAVLILFVSLGFLSANLSVLTPSFNFSSGSNLYNISLNNTGLNSANFTQVNITFPASFSLTATTNGTNNLTGYNLFINGKTLSWSNSTVGLMLNNSVERFWVNATAAAPGTYYINITTLDNYGIINRSSATIIINGVARAAVDFGNAANFTILAETTITDANPSVSRITGNVGLSPAAGSAIASVSCTHVNGTIYEVNAGYTGGYDSNTSCAAPGPGANKTYVDNAIIAMMTAYNDARGRTLPDATELGSGEIGGLTIYPGLYKWSTPVTISNDVTLDCSGNASAVFIFQMSSTLTVSNGKKVILSGGCLASNIFWQADTAVTLGTTSVLNGNILAGTAVTINTGSQLNGRVMAQSAVTLDGNYVTLPVAAIADILPPVVAINSPISSSNQTSKTIALDINSTDVNMNYTSIIVYNSTGSIINSTINTTSGNIIVSLKVLIDGVYTINATAYDLFGNINSASRSITVDSTGPVASTFASPILVNSYTASTGIIPLNISIIDAGVGVSYVKFNITNFTGAQQIILTINNAGAYYYNTTGLNISSWSDGIYKIKLIANDSLNNNATNVEIGNLTIDRTAPSILTFIPLYTSQTGLIFNVNISDAFAGVNSSCVVDRAGASVSTMGTSQNISESGLTCSKNYVYTLSCSDSVGNVNTTSVTFTTSACEKASSSSSMSSGSLSSPAVNNTVVTPQVNQTSPANVAPATNTNAAPATNPTTNAPVNNIPVKSNNFFVNLWNNIISWIKSIFA